jgi:hypothetical protein
MNARFWLLGKFLIAAAALLPGGAARAADDGWRTCADEGQTCELRGRAVVRYGDNDRWTTRTVDGSVGCNNETFGDPAPEVRKRCQVRAGYGGPAQGGGDNGDWRFCAAEGETCQFRGRTEVRFGDGRRFSTRTAYDRVRCDTSDFGDPVPGVTKYCEVRAAAAVGGGSGRPDYGNGNGNGNSGANAWRYCASENQVCQIRGRAEVRFGEGRRYVTRTVRDQVNCDVATFGDPADGILKHCEVRAQAANDPGGAGWSRCADEGQACRFDGRAQVRYGAAGRYVYRDGLREVTCDTRSFGADPVEGRVKHCEIRR